MLATTVFTIKNSIEAAIMLLVLFSLLQKLNQDKTDSKLPQNIVGLAMIIGILLAYAVKWYLDREVVEAFLRLVSVLAALILVGLIWIRPVVVGTKHLGLLGLFLLINPSMEIAYFFLNLVLRNNGFINTELLLRFAGGAIAITIVYFLYQNAFSLKKKLSVKTIQFWSSLILVLYLARQTIGVFHLLMVLGYLPITKLAVAIIAPFINTWQPLFFYFFFLALAGWVGQAAWQLSWRVEEGYPNPAQRRKALSKIVKNKRYLQGFILVVLLITGVIGGNYYLENRQVTLSPAKSVVAETGSLRISRDELADKNLHRYGFVTPGGTEMRFIVIKKGEEVYGVGLDACLICGTVGYYQHKSEVVCLNCDVIINIPTIGFPGGCNPIPLDYSLTKDAIIITEAVLLAAEEEFK